MLKSTEIVIEQLVIGLFAFLIIAIFLFDPKWLKITTTGGEAFFKFAAGVLIVIGAYAAGIVIDRWSDTLLDRLYNINRFKTITKRMKFSELCEETCDPYPESFLRMEIREKGDHIADYHGYLRTRMRITRAITCLLPAFFLSLQSVHTGICVQQRRLTGIVTLGLYVGLILIAIICVTKNQPPRTDDIKAFSNEDVKQSDKDPQKAAEGRVRNFIKKLWVMIRSCFRSKKDVKKQDRNFRRYVMERDADFGNYAKKFRNVRSENNKKNQKIRVKMRLRDYIDQSILGLAIFTGLSVVIAGLHSGTKLAGIWPYCYPAALFLMTFLVGQTWWRISQTFFTFLYDFKYCKS